MQTHLKHLLMETLVVCRISFFCQSQRNIYPHETFLWLQWPTFKILPRSCLVRSEIDPSPSLECLGQTLQSEGTILTIKQNQLTRSLLSIFLKLVLIFHNWKKPLDISTCKLKRTPLHKLIKNYYNYLDFWRSCFARSRSHWRIRRRGARPSSPGRTWAS